MRRSGLPAALLLTSVLLGQDLNTAAAALKAGDLDAAERQLKALLVQSPGNPQAHHNLGVVYQQRGEHAQAIRSFREAAKLAPQHAPSRMLLGVSLGVAGRHAEAVEALEMAAELEPKNPRIAYYLARAYQRLSAWSADVLQAKASKSARYHQLRAEALARKGLTSESLAEYGKAIEVDAEMPGSHLGRAMLYLQLRRTVEAIRELEAELVISPESSAARSLKARLTRN